MSFFSLANPFEIDFALASALSAKGVHLRLKILLQGLCLGFDEAAIALQIIILNT